jgi:hypothetical protein
MTVIRAHVSIAEARRGDVIQRARRQIDQLQAEIDRGAVGAAGFQDSYLLERAGFLRDEKARLEGEIDRLSNLSNEELVTELVPEVASYRAAEDNPLPPLSESLDQRGPMLPQQVVVHRDPPPAWREGGDPVAPWEQAGGAGAPPGWQPGQVYTYPEN